MWWLASPQDLHRIEDWPSTVYVERSHIDRDDNTVVLVNKDRTVRIPAALVATVLLGQEHGSPTAPSGSSPTPARQYVGSENEACECMPPVLGPAEVQNC